jgi:hypothetical protein
MKAYKRCSFADLCTYCYDLTALLSILYEMYDGRTYLERKTVTKKEQSLNLQTCSFLLIRDLHVDSPDDYNGITEHRLLASWRPRFLMNDDNGA